MAEGKIKRGFATYLFILLMVFVAAFLIIIVVMIFSPFKNVLGFKYLSYNMSNNIVQTSSEQDIDFSTINELYVNCNNANVVIQRDNNIDTDTIRIENTCKGFARSSDNTSFDYNITLSGASNDVLNIDVHEPEGFLFFDKTVTISILIPAKSSYNFENTDALNAWINQKTFGLINNLFNDISDFNFILVNSLAIDMEWVNKIQNQYEDYLIEFPHEKKLHHYGNETYESSYAFYIGALNTSYYHKLDFE